MTCLTSRDLYRNVFETEAEEEVWVIAQVTHRDRLTGGILYSTHTREGKYVRE